VPTEHVLIFGAGGHAAVVVDALVARKSTTKLTIVDDNPELEGATLLGFMIHSTSSMLDIPVTGFHAAIGDGVVRKAVSARLTERFGTPVTIVHPDATISEFAELDSGCFVAARSVLGPRCKIGSAVIVNHAAVIDHDCTIGDFSHIAPTASLGGQVVVGKCVLIGAGANVLPGLNIGDGATIGAGAVVTKDVPKEAVVTGIPAVIRKQY
jgi:sugar O-acyltransferase (sialic acid O-acetyltransferase NeuD family)